VALQAAKKAGLVGRRRVLDSTPLYDAVATMDTVSLIRSAIRRVWRAANCRASKSGHLKQFEHGGRRARVRGKVKVGADFNLLAAAANLARLAVLGVRYTPSGWAAPTA
jgi:hypothetical protein